MDMTPKTKGAMLRASRSLCQGGHSDLNPPEGLVPCMGPDNRILKMTLCGSEVPQDRWRGRTAGSGMWTQTRESVLGAPCGDSAIPYG